MKTAEAAAISEGLNTQTHAVTEWTEDELGVIYGYEQKGMSHGAAVKKLQSMKAAGTSASQQLVMLRTEASNEAAVKEHKPKAHKEGAVKTKKAAKTPKPKKETAKRLSDYGHGKAARMAESKKTGTPEMELCARYSRKYGLDVPPCVLAWEKKAEQREAKAAKKAAAAKK